jgi:hypothetical protein
MNLYTIYSHSHEYLFDIMRGSMVNCNVAMRSKKAPQVCKSGDYGSSDAINFYYLKILYILELLHTETEPFVFSDVDMYFFRDFSQDLRDRLKDNDMLIQYEKNVMGLPATCNGFMYLRPNKKTKDAFAWVLKNLHWFKGDQQALNAYFYTHLIKVGLLPKTYYSINYDNGNKVWNGEDVGITVKDPFLVHLHWTIGNRLGLLDMIKSKII